MISIKATFSGDFLARKNAGDPISVDETFGTTLYGGVDDNEEKSLYHGTVQWILRDSDFPTTKRVQVTELETVICMIIESEAINDALDV